MKDNFSWLTPKQAAELIGFTPRHVQNLISHGKLSATKEDGKYYIEKSEFFRLYPKAYKKEQEGNSSFHIAERQRLEYENTVLKDTNSKQDKEIEFLRNQIESMSGEKIRMLDTIVSTTKLLEFKSEQVQQIKKEKKSISWKKFNPFKKSYPLNEKEII